MYKELAVKISAMFGKMKANEVQMELQYLMDEFYELNPVVGSYDGDHVTYIAEDDETIERIMSIVNQIGEPFSLFFDVDTNSRKDDRGVSGKNIYIDQSIFRVNGNVDFQETLHEFFKSTTGVWIHSCS
jgi:hypothetical protein